jgi:hypothetical protein
MIASVYIKDGSIHIYNEKSSLSGIGGIAYELGRPLLDVVCYEPERFEEAFSTRGSQEGVQAAPFACPGEENDQRRVYEMV